MAQKVTLITGCSTGIGLTMAVKLAKDAAKKYLVYPTMRNLEKRAPLEEAAGSVLDDTLFVRQLDVIDDDSVANAVQNIMDTHGRIDVVINNAGIACFNPLEYMPLGDIRDVIETNLFGTIRMLQAVLPHMKECKSGHIINVSSVGGIVGYPFYDTYCASKHAIEGLTEALATRMKPHNIKLTSLVPGPVHSNINENIAQGNRLPPKQNIDPITRQQLKNLATHQKFHFDSQAQTAEEIADIVQHVIEMDHTSRAVRFQTSDYVRDMSKIKYSDFGAAKWIEYIQYLVDTNQNQTPDNHKPLGSSRAAQEDQSPKQS